MASARAAVRAAKRLGLAKGSTLFIDIEDYDNTANGCNPPVVQVHVRLEPPL